MAIWAFTCKKCGAVFEHSKIGQSLADYFIPAKPVFPKEGQEFECPHCKVRSVYMTHELTYVLHHKT